MAITSPPWAGCARPAGFARPGPGGTRTRDGGVPAAWWWAVGEPAECGPGACVSGPGRWPGGGGRRRPPVRRSRQAGRARGYWGRGSRAVCTWLPPPGRGAGADELGQVGRVGGAGGDPGFGACLVAGHALDWGSAHGRAVAEHARFGRARVGVPPVEDYATCRRAGSVGHAKVSCSFREAGMVWLAGPGDSRPPGPALACQVVLTVWSAGMKAYASTDTPR